METVSDGNTNWTCTGWTEDCNDGASVMSCSWNGGHVYPVVNHTEDWGNWNENPWPSTNWTTNFGLEAAWQFMSEFQRIPSDAVSRDSSDSSDSMEVTDDISMIRGPGFDGPQKEESVHGVVSMMEPHIQIVVVVAMTVCVVACILALCGEITMKKGKGYIGSKYGQLELEKQIGDVSDAAESENDLVEELY